MTTHGATVGGQSRAYNSWAGAKKRCSDKKGHKWPLYGGRGITMCKRWRDDFSAFYSDMGDPPANFSIDRIDTNGHYSCGKCPDCQERGLPANCRWATAKVQARNTRTNVNITVEGATACVAEWAERTGVDARCILGRVQRGVEGAALVASEPMSARFITGPDGTTLRLHEWATKTGISASTICTRIKDGWSPALAATTPRTHRHYPAANKR